MHALSHTQHEIANDTSLFGTENVKKKKRQLGQMKHRHHVRKGRDTIYGFTARVLSGDRQRLSS